MTQMIRRAAIFFLMLWSAAGRTMAGEISPAGERLARVLDGMDVENRWQAGRPVSWRTGEFNPRQRQHATHCSAFVAAACDRMGVSILRPPEHPQTLLANAQNAWLKAEGARFGWRQVAPPEAQELANEGVLVLASYSNPNRHRPGHIAVVRPSDKPDRLLAEEGPQVIMAGTHNRRSTSARLGFEGHRAWEHHAIDFFAHVP